MAGRKRKIGKTNKGVKFDINPNSTMATDIDSLMHFQNESKFVIRFSDQRNCSQPQLLGRLSGPALTKVNWEKYHLHQNDTGADAVLGNKNHGDDNVDYNVLVGYYNVPVPGRYFLEIIVLMCIEFQLETDFTPVCIEDTHRHRLTLNGAFIQANPLQVDSQSIIGYWYNTLTNETQKPLYTRYQPAPEHCNGHNCTDIVDTSRFDPYAFYFASQIGLETILKGKEGNICFEGASHAHELFLSTTKTLRSLNATIQGRIQVISPDPRTNFAREFNVGKVQQIIDKKCTKVVIGSGQWDAGWPKNRPTLFTQYENVLNSTIPTMLEMFQDANVDVYYRSMHYNPLGNKISQCPPRDWRNPAVVDMYNRVSKHECEKFNMTFLDTNDIMGIMWDRASDWCHYRDISSEMEARYFLHTIFA